MKHTPGPWEARFNLHGQAVVNGIHGIQVAHFGDNSVYSKDGSYSISKEEAMANARLFAAAPDLLEAAKDILDLKRTGREAWEKLKAAIKKAGGSGVTP